LDGVEGTAEDATRRAVGATAGAEQGSDEKRLSRYPTEQNVLVTAEGVLSNDAAVEREREGEEEGDSEVVVVEDLWGENDGDTHRPLAHSDDTIQTGKGDGSAEPRGRSVSDPNRRSKDKDRPKPGSFSTSGGVPSPSSKLPAGKLALGRSISWTRKGSKSTPKSPASNGGTPATAAEGPEEVTLVAGAGKLGEAEGSYQSL
jgi:hypothetical protein